MDKELKKLQKVNKFLLKKIDRIVKDNEIMASMEPFVICRKCGKRLRANTMERLTYCDCCMTAVRGNDKFFIIDSKKNNHIVIYQSFKDYILNEKDLWSI